ncbi:MAG: diaminopimelate epimerase [Planctomycetes bacterium]|nr:diaminopimelate epimerase [Planctomycetota bacterium]
MKFTKMHGTGNDFIVIDVISRKVTLTIGQIRRLCDRRFGVGSDGIILVLKSQRKGADFRMRMFNPDGSEAEMCGNGIRCLGKFVYDRRLTSRKELAIETLAGLVSLSLSVNAGKVTKVKVALPEPVAIKKCSLGMGLTGATSVSLGNPHCVILVDKVDKFPVEKYGPLVERHKLFPNRRSRNGVPILSSGTNVEFVEIINKGVIKQRTWERGAGETLACGTGATAAAVAGIYNGKLKSPVTVHLKGGDLTIEWRKGKYIYLTGPAETVFSSEIPPPSHHVGMTWRKHER